MVETPWNGLGMKEASQDSDDINPYTEQKVEGERSKVSTFVICPDLALGLS